MPTRTSRPSVSRAHLSSPTKHFESSNVDLAWHTHQIAPRRYHPYSIKTTLYRFVDHDDKIPENGLSKAFEWTSKQYQKLTNGQIYSECICWYCEAVRETHNYGGLFTRSATAVARQSAIQPHNRADISSDPNKSPHISAHNSVHVIGDSAFIDARQTKVEALKSRYEAVRRRIQNRKREGTLGSGVGNWQDASQANQSSNSSHMPLYALAYGVPLLTLPFLLPYAPDPAITNELYPCDPICVTRTPGAAGNCVAGTCGGGVSAGACCGDGGAGGGDGSGAGGDGGGGGGCGGC
ncbi:hypothetical protein VTO42DRAFT_4497 [Malbranchea cinnamomea]